MTFLGPNLQINRYEMPKGIANMYELRDGHLQKRM